MQRSRPFRFVSKAAPDSSGAAVYTFRANDGQPDRYMDRVSVTGWKLDSYNANPVVLFNHDEFAALPIGKGRAYVEGDALMVDVSFDPTDEFAKKVEAKVAGGFLNAVSVRYLMTEFEPNDLGGFDSFEQDLLEISIVTIPGNQRAVRVKSLEPSEIEEIAKSLAALLKKEAPPPEEKPEEKTPPPPDEKPEEKASPVECPECGHSFEPSAEEPEAEDAPPPEEKFLSFEKIAREVARLTLHNLKEKTP